MGAFLLAIAPASAQSLVEVREWDEARAAHLLRRAGFGGTPEQIAHLVTIGARAAVNELVDYEKTRQGHRDYQPFDIPDEKTWRREYERLTGFDPDKKEQLAQKLIQTQRHLEIMQINDFRAWWIQRMILTTRPLQEKMTLFWHGHFTSGFREVRESQWMIRQNEFLRDHAVGSFRDLLLGIAQDPAMLRYLDNASNTKEHPNENFARELLELFTMGVGHYTEQDVREAARAFTGWTLDRGQFVIAPKKHDGGEKKFLGERGNFDGEDIIDIILRRNATSRHLATKLLVFFVQENPPESLVSALELEIRRKKFNLREVLRVLFLSEAFYSDQARFSLVKSPIELIVGTCRLLEIGPANSHALALAADGMGQTLFQPPSVKGWDGGLSWINTATLYTRYSFAARLLEGNAKDDKMMIMDKEARDLEMALEMLRGVLPSHFPGLQTPRRSVVSTPQPAFDPQDVIKGDCPEAPTAIATYWTDRLLQQPLETAGKEELERILTEPRNKKEPVDVNRSMRALVTAILCLPEYQVY